MALDDWQRDVIERLTRIETMVEEDHKALHGNGHAGLITRVTNMEATNKAHAGWITHVIGGIGWLIAMIVSSLNAWGARHG